MTSLEGDADVFPADCVHFTESIPAVSLRAVRPGAMLEVIVGEVYSPSHFWLIRLGDHYNIAMEDMMDEMTHYYNGEGRSRTLARGAVRVGHYCSSLYERDWHRSLIVKIIDSDTVKVRHVDYGTPPTGSHLYWYCVLMCSAGSRGDEPGAPDSGTGGGATLANE
uniref:Tudor domain-containing protein n=1 Tax=Heliothis virescens TaxID=7102 RepID=A0A2A4JK98_HELVI